MLANGLYDVPPGKVAAVVTYLEMRAQATLRPAQLSEGVVFKRVEQTDPTTYKDLFRRVGGINWLWFSRLTKSEAEISAILSDPNVALYVLESSGRSEGMLELDFRSRDECELAFFGLTSKLIGTGAGRYLMNKAIELAWSRQISRFHVHTCTLDHPAALSFYQRSGFTPVCQKIEIANDPRGLGLLPDTAGPHIPIFR